MKCSGVNCRTVLWHLIFFGCAVNYMLRSHINIALVAMVKDHHSEKLDKNLENENFTQNASVNYSNKISEEGTNKLLNMIHFNWDEREQSYVLGAFYWSYWMTQIAGGELPKYFGTKKVFGLGNLFLCITTLFIPLFSKWNLWAIVALRLLQGFGGGVCWPSLHHMVASWIPPNERSKFMSAYTGSSIGAAITYPLCGLIIYYFGWEAVFYTTGSLGIVWYCVWWLLAYDTPACHPHITQVELTFIKQSLGETLSDKKVGTPWCKILTSLQVWLTISVSWGCLWGMFTLLTQAPTYFQFVHGWGIRMNGFLSGIPHLCRSGLGIGLGFICDLLLEKKIFTHNTVRKIAACVCSSVQSLFFIGLALFGHNVIVAVICLTLALASTGAEGPGPLASYIDLCPNHASSLMGLANLVSVVPATLSAILVGYLTYENPSIGQWQIIFYISAAMAFIPGIAYLLLGNSEVQYWNNIEGQMIKEMQPLKQSSAKKKYHHKYKEQV